ncbi:hypothetical protein EC988_005910, partial [Linderina pennispora]
MHAPQTEKLKRRLASIHDSAQRQTAHTPQAMRQPTIAAKPEPFINEQFVGFLAGGPFNRFALALKSQLENEIDWACARLVPATHQCPDTWTLHQHAPFLVEAMLSILERSRSELASPSKPSDDVKAVLLADVGSESLGQRASERADLLATALFNIAQIGENAGVMAQDPRLIIEATSWLKTDGHAAIKANMLDLLDMLLPLAPQPPFDTCIKTWPVFGSREAITLDPLVLVETCLWEQLVCVLCESQERTLVLGAIRVLVQAIAWHPQLAREVLELSVPDSLSGHTVESVGELVNRRLSELILSPDVELVSAALELLLNTVRLEAMANALDDELDVYAERTGKGKKRRKVRGIDISEPQSGTDSGTQTPVFGLRPLSRSISVMQNEESEPSMLPDGLAALVALVSQQWLSAACPPVLDDSKTEPTKHSSNTQPQTAPEPANKPPTEPELREACTWVLLNYELCLVPPGQQPSVVRMSELYRRYMIAKQGQTVPRIGRALNPPEIVRVVAAVFPKAPLQNAGQRGQDNWIAMHLKAKSQNIVPIPAVVVDAAEQSKPEPEKKPPNTCLWFECDQAFDSEQAALEHLHSHMPGADACRWSGCNRLPATGCVPAWLPTHILTHGP